MKGSKCGIKYELDVFNVNNNINDIHIEIKKGNTPKFIRDLYINK
jgi:hypothetical protein